MSSHKRNRRTRKRQAARRARVWGIFAAVVVFAAGPVWSEVVTRAIAAAFPL